MRVLVTGGRDYADAEAVYDALNTAVPSLVIQGGAGGADAIARAWAAMHGVACFQCDAPWNAFGRSAGPIRNGWMIEHGTPDLVIAFPGGAGTADCVRRARAGPRIDRHVLQQALAGSADSVVALAEVVARFYRDTPGGF